MGEIARRRLLLLDVLAALGFVLLPQVSVLRPALGGAVDHTTVWLLSAATALPLAVRRLRPTPVFVFVLTAACVALAAGLGPVPFLAAAYALYPVAVTRPGGTRLSTVVVGGVSTAGAAALTLTGGQRYEGGTLGVQLVFGLLVLGATWAAGAAVRERRESVRRTVEQAAERAKVIEDVSKRALRDMRATLKVMRHDAASAEDLRRPALRLSDLPELLRTAEAAGVRVELRSHCPEDLPDGVALSAFRIVQEALTNVVKHAAPTRCRVHLGAQDGALTIEVEDDGPGSGHRPTVPGGGLGLVGMRERAAAHGGALTAGPRERGGFRVSARLPY
ncbi:sensor histidine kinase [Streptomyces sp. NPDC090022]|uniref:sensor histidine kinase n=1 Tax=Streptomyces sp. NPDC090022 TaxID=3365920 RepID=UPI00380A3D87